MMTDRLHHWRQVFLDGLRHHPVANVISRQSKSDGSVNIILTKEFPDLAFGAGKRICLGRHLAITEGAIVLERFFKTFIVEKIEVPRGPIKQNVMNIDQPGPIILTVRRR